MPADSELSRRTFLAAATAGAAFPGMVFEEVGGVRPRRATRVGLSKPGPMIPPVPAILLTVRGEPGDPDHISVVWTFVVNGDPPHVGVSVGDEHAALGLIERHREFVLNVPFAGSVSMR